AKQDAAALRKAIDARVVKYRDDYAEYYRAFAEPSSPALRDSNPSVVVIPGLGLFGFGKDKREARITTEFFVNAIHVMQGANALEDTASERSDASHANGAGFGVPASERAGGSGGAKPPGQKDAASERSDANPSLLPQVRRPEQAREFTTFHNYVALPRLE